MTTLNDIVNVTVTTATATPTRQGFGIPMFAGFHSEPGALLQEFASFQAVLDAGFTKAAYPWIYNGMLAAFSQTPRPPKVLLGRRDNVAAQVVELVPTSIVEGDVISVDINATTATYTVANGDVLADVLAGLETAITALSLSVTTDDTSGTKLVATGDTAGHVFSYSALSNVQFTDVSTDGGIATDLTAIRASSSEWYGFAIDSLNETEAMAAAAWAEATGFVLFFADAVDQEVLDVGDSDDLASRAKAAGYDRTVTMFNTNPGTYLGLGWMCDGLPDDPGSRTWAYQKVAGVSVTSLSEGEQTVCHDKNCNTYTNIAGLPTTMNGVCASGEFIDVVRFRDWFVSRLKEEVFFCIYNNKKLPYTNNSVEVIKGVIDSVIAQGIAVGGISTDTDPVITAPDVNGVLATKRANRLLPDIGIFFRLAGAIHKTGFNVTLSV